MNGGKAIRGIVRQARGVGQVGSLGGGLIVTHGEKRERVKREEPCQKGCQQRGGVTRKWCFGGV